MFWDAVLYAVLIIGASGSGFFAGAVPDRTVFVKRFFIGLGIAVLCTLPVLLTLPILNNSDSPAAPMVRKIAIWLLLAAPIFYLVAFNCRKTAGNFRNALWGIPLCIGLLFLCFVPAVCGMTAFLTMILDFSPFYTASDGISGVLLFLLVLLGAWSVRAYFSSRAGWKVLLGMSVLPGFCFLACWLVALPVMQLYAYSAEKKAQAEGVVPATFDWKLSPETEAFLKQVTEFYKNHKNFSLPFQGIYSWHGKTGEKLIPEENRRETLNLFQSPEFEAILAAEAAALAPFEKTPMNTGQILNSFRSYARNRAGRAALFRETGQTEKILPELETCLHMLKNMPRQTMLLSELVLNAVYDILTAAAVSLGPDGKEYAPFYRELLSCQRSRSPNLPDDAGFFLGIKRSESWQKTHFAYPMNLAEAAKGIHRELMLRPLLRQLETDPAPEMKEWYSKIPDNYRNAAHVYRQSQALGILAAALKLYRSEHGAYPDTLEKLVPEYLDALPVFPNMKKPYRYVSDGHRFELEPDVENGKKFQKTSEPVY